MLLLGAIPKAKGPYWAVLGFFLFGAGVPPVLAGPFGDGKQMEEGLRGRGGILFFGGFESEPWASVWGMAWGPGPGDHGSLVSGPAAFRGRSLRVRYPRGAIGGEGGYQFLTDFSKFPIEPKESIYLRYYVRFDPGFDFVKGGKLPGLAGGEANTGGHKPDGRDGWSARVMWRADGKIVQYVYHPDQAGEYGEDFAWDLGGCPRFFTPGKWQCLETYVRMNSPGKRDGILLSWLDGEKALEVKGLRFRDVPSLKIDKLYFDTFFGGGDPSWAPPSDQYAQFDDFVLAEAQVGPVPSSPGMEDPREAGRDEGVQGPGLLIYDGEGGGWRADGWNEGRYDFASVKNHGPGGRYCALVQFPAGGWGGAQFTGPQVAQEAFRDLSFWVWPTGCDVEFRVRLEEGGSQTGQERPVTAGPRHGWKVGQWNLVRLPLADFRAPGAFNRVVLTSNSSKGVSPFYVDDLVLEK